MTSKTKIKSFLKRIKETFPLSFHIYRALKNLPKYPGFIKQFLCFRKTGNAERFEIKWKDLYPCLNDKTTTTSFDRHYVFHTAWAARILARTLPQEHIDISSSIYFVALVSAFVKVRFYDYRPAELNLSGLNSEAVNLLALPFPDMSLHSLSCMHVVEHIGLGRYGEPLDYDADLKAISELKRVLAKGGNLLFVVPVGKPKVMFNAHRIYSYSQILGYFRGLEMVNFALIPDKNGYSGIVENATQETADAQEYGCGCFWFRKKE